MKITILPERLLDVARTKDDANMLLVHIDAVVANLFKSTSRPIEVISAFMPYAKKEWSLSLIRENDLDITNSGQVQAFFQALKETLLKINVVEITLAFEPKDEFVRILSDWFFTHCKKPVIIDLHLNLEIIGGVIIGYKGNYKDCSVGKVLKEKQKNGELRLSI